jgi:hypothetical protein
VVTCPECGRKPLFGGRNRERLRLAEAELSEVDISVLPF